MRAPAFWWRPRAGPWALLLAPFGAIYGGVTAWRMGRRGARAGVPVVCIGNFVAGGAGKTPTAIAIARLLMACGETPVFLSRGYRGSLSSSRRPVRVDPARHAASQVGDEPLLLARIAPTIVAARRGAGARAAREAGASVIVMDDGLQNSTLCKDVAIAVVDGATGIGNGLAMPAGPLRAPLGAQIRHVDAVLVIGSGRAGETMMRVAKAAGKKALSAALAADPAVAGRLGGRSVVAFAGIGRPDKFFATLSEIGAQVVARRAFADHHVYQAHEIAGLRRLAHGHDALLVTTEKDAVRIAENERQGLVVLPVSLIFEDAAAAAALLAEKLAAARRSLQPDGTISC
jgi:tetraacyldisaccharide 4'-kinase